MHISFKKTKKKSIPALSKNKKLYNYNFNIF